MSTSTSALANKIAAFCMEEICAHLQLIESYQDCDVDEVAIVVQEVLDDATEWVRHLLSVASAARKFTAAQRHLDEVRPNFSEEDLRAVVDATSEMIEALAVLDATDPDAMAAALGDKT